MRLSFTKMHGLGNDFVMLDSVSQRLRITPEKVKKISDRNFGIGCDQLLIVEPPQSSINDFRYRIFNQNGEEVENCGNGARCFAIYVRQRNLTQKRIINVETAGGNLVLKVDDDDMVTVNMGIPILDPDRVPFNAKKQSLTYQLPVDGSEYEISAVSMGNPHSIMLVDDVAKAPVKKLGPKIESHRQFPNRVNAGFLQVVSPTKGKLRVFERGVGETLACGTGACAAMVAGHMQNLFSDEVDMKLLGGHLTLRWEGEGKPVMMTGPATTVFHGQIKI